MNKESEHVDELIAIAEVENTKTDTYLITCLRSCKAKGTKSN